MDKFLESYYKEQVRVACKAALSSDNFKEAIEELKAKKTDLPVEMKEQHDKIDSTIETLATRLEEKLLDSRKLVEEKETTLAEIQAKLETVEKAHKAMCEQYKKATAIIEKAGLSEKDDVKTLKEDTKAMLEDIETFKEDRKAMLDDIKIFQEEVAARDADIKIFIENEEAMLGDIKEFKVRYAKQKKIIESLKVKIKKMKEEFEDVNPYDGVTDEGLTDLDFGSDEVEYGIEDDLDWDDSESLESGEDDFIMEEDESEDEDKEKVSEEDETEEDAEENDDESEMSEEDESEDEDEELEEEDDSEEDEKEKVAESKRKRLTSKRKAVKESIKPSRELIEYYKRAVKRNPSVKDIRTSVLSSKSLMEATRKVSAYVNKKSDDMKLVESTKKSKGQEYTFEYNK